MGLAASLRMLEDALGRWRYREAASGANGSLSQPASFRHRLVRLDADPAKRRKYMIDLVDLGPHLGPSSIDPVDLAAQSTGAHGPNHMSQVSGPDWRSGVGCG